MNKFEKMIDLNTRLKDATLNREIAVEAESSADQARVALLDKLHAGPEHWSVTIRGSLSKDLARLNKACQDAGFARKNAVKVEWELFEELVYEVSDVVGVLGNKRLPDNGEVDEHFVLLVNKLCENIAALVAARKTPNKLEIARCEHALAASCEELRRMYSV